MIDYTVHRLTDREQFLSDWASLYSQCAAPEFFHSPAWIEAWVGCAPESADLYRVEARRDGELLLLGAFTKTRRQPPVFGLREAWFQEFGDPALDAVYGEYSDLLVACKAPSDTRAKAVAVMVDATPDADGFVFRNVQKELATAIYAVANEKNMDVRVLREQPTYACDLTGDFQSGLSKSLLTKIRRSMRLYVERGPLAVRKVEDGDAWRSAWNKMVALHEAGWRARGLPSVFDNKQLIAFHERLRLAAPEDVHLLEVKAGEETIAVLYNFSHGDRIMNYQCGFLYEDDNRLAPGFVSHTLAAQYYSEAGFKIYDLLAGEADYKSRLGNPESTLTSLVLERPTWRNRIRSLVRR